MKDHAISRTAIIILSIVMIVFGIFHFLQPKSLLSYVPPYLPGGIVWVYVVGIAFILAAVAFILNKLQNWQLTHLHYCYLFLCLLSTYLIIQMQEI
jgi:uncharacterized membrane protein